MRPQARALVLALMAMALLPTIARAESSSEMVYPLAGANVESIGPLKTGKSEPTTEADAPGHKAHRHAQPSTGEEALERTATEPEVRHKARVAPPGNGFKHPPGGDGASPKAAVGPGAKPRTSVSPRRGVATPKQVEPAGGGGGSSPVVPILIAVAVLAALSISVVLYRERRGDGPDSVNPPA
jgi:hypothetical protein